MHSIPVAVASPGVDAWDALLICLRPNYLAAKPGRGMGRGETEEREQA